jgi:tail protein P2 I
MSLTADELYDLLPAIYRIRDAECNQPLRALVQVLADQAIVMEEDIAQLYDNWFIETCDEWVVPYISDLLGVRGLHPIEGATFTQRALVANTIGHRRRKGTATMLEQLARDTTGWNARAVEFFELLGWTQNYNHIRAENFRTYDLRRTNDLELLDTAFDKIAHTVDVRHIVNARGRHNISNVGIFLWRLQSYFLPRSQARAATALADGRFFSDALGLDVPLFNRPETETEVTHLAEETNVPGGLRRRPLYDELEARRQAIVDLSADWELSKEGLDLLGADGIPNPVSQKLLPLIGMAFASEQDFVNALSPLLTAVELTQFKSTILGRAAHVASAVYFDEQPVFEIFIQASAGDPFLRVPPEEVMICNLTAPLPAVPEVWLRPLATKTYTVASSGATQSRPISVAIDPVLGRIALPKNVLPSAVKVSCASGFSGDLGGGPYDRRDSLLNALPSSSAVTWQAGVSKEIPPVPGEIFATIGDALLAWNLQPKGSIGLIAIMDSSTYKENLAITLPAESVLLIAAADWPEVVDITGPHRILGQFAAFERRSHVLGDVKVNGNAASNDPPGKLALNGLLIEGGVSITAVGNANLGELRVDHCTIVPSMGGLRVNGKNAALQLLLMRSICGAINLPPSNVPTLRIEDCIIDGNIAALAAELAVEKSTVIGQTTAKQLVASSSIFTDVVTIPRREVGCVRFCSLAKNSKTPRRFRCQPDLGLEGIDPPEQAPVRARLTPSFTSTRYGNPAYAQLSLACATEIRAGADDGSEMGAFNFLKQPQREINLRSSPDEYLRFGLEAGLIFVT